MTATRDNEPRRTGRGAAPSQASRANDAKAPATAVGKDSAKAAGKDSAKAAGKAAGPGAGTARPSRPSERAGATARGTSASTGRAAPRPGATRTVRSAGQRAAGPTTRNAARPATRGAATTGKGRGPAPKRSQAPAARRGSGGPGGGDGRGRRGRLRISRANPRRRVTVMFAAVLAIFAVFAAQLLRIQAFDASATQAAALNKRQFTAPTPALRGEILDTNGHVLAESVERFTVTVDPVAVKEYRARVDGTVAKVGAAGAAAAIAPLLGMSVTDLTGLLTRSGTRYVIIKKLVNPTVWAQIRALGVPGIASERTAERLYPSGMALGQLVGFVLPSDQKPGGGIEQMLNGVLAGTPGKLVAEQARDGYVIPGSQRVDTPVVNGRDVKLTIDADLQWYAQNALAKQVTAVGAESGTAVVIEAATGKVRAAASYPSFDPNNLATAKKANLGNVAFNDSFEPGSTGKLMTLAAALEEKVITPDTGVIVPSRLPRADTRFKDNEAHGIENMTATGVIAKSSNMGTILIGERVKTAVMASFYRKFGVGHKTPIGFPGESAGELVPAAKLNAQQRYTMLFGQGYAVTAVQAASIFATIA
ncbi:MAG: penicillin-binding transpeptidase domain-containing protein, partial [Terracoccus sp.]